MATTPRRAWISWIFVAFLALLCGFLAVLQSRWISELSRAEKERLQQQLQAGLNRLSRDFNIEIATAFAGLVPTTSQIEDLGRERAYSAQYLHWKESHDHTFSRIALVVPHGNSLTLLNLDFGSGEFVPADWPASWTAMRDRMLAHLSGGGGGPFSPADSALIELPRFAPNNTQAVGSLSEQEWLIAELNLDTMRSSFLPELLRRHLGSEGKFGYRAEVVLNAEPKRVIFQSAAGSQESIDQAPDAWVNLFDVNMPPNRAFRGLQDFRHDMQPGRMRMPPPPPDNRSQAAKEPLHPDRGPSQGFVPVPPPEGGRGRWRLLVQHQAGSLEAVVAQARWHNAVISGGILLLILATVAAQVRFSRRAQRLAELQMNFVAGVSHELRTPLTVINTAAFNLQGDIATKPQQVERYGKLIQEESGKLTSLVEQILRFASVRAGHVIRATEPVTIESLIEEALRNSTAQVEKQVQAGLPLVMADKLAMKHAFQNLLDNALKYGTDGDNWIGIFASSVEDKNGPAVEIRVADHGPGIPLDEQEHVFDPFFRGRQAIHQQVHGTGLGLNLVKKIVEAHGGTIRVHSGPHTGTEFVVRLPAMAGAVA